MWMTYIMFFIWYLLWLIYIHYLNWVNPPYYGIDLTPYYGPNSNNPRGLTQRSFCTSASPPNKKLSREEKAELELTSKQIEILTGILVAGGGSLKLYGNYPNLVMEFGYNSFAGEPYSQYCYNELGSIITSEPRRVNRKADSRTGQVYESTRMRSYSLPCLFPIYNHFVIDGVRIIPQDLSASSPFPFTIHSLVALILNSGTESQWGGLVLSINRFSYEELVCLGRHLETEFHLEYSVLKQGPQLGLQLKRRSYYKLSLLLADLIPEGTGGIVFPRPNVPSVKRRLPGVHYDKFGVKKF